MRAQANLKITVGEFLILQASAAVISAALAQRPRLAVSGADEALFVIDPRSSTLMIAHH